MVGGSAVTSRWLRLAAHPPSSPAARASPQHSNHTALSRSSSCSSDRPSSSAATRCEGWGEGGAGVGRMPGKTAVASVVRAAAAAAAAHLEHAGLQLIVPQHGVALAHLVRQRPGRALCVVAARAAVAFAACEAVLECLLKRGLDPAVGATVREFVSCAIGGGLWRLLRLLVGAGRWWVGCCCGRERSPLRSPPLLLLMLGAWRGAGERTPGSWRQHWGGCRCKRTGWLVTVSGVCGGRVHLKPRLRDTLQLYRLTQGRLQRERMPLRRCAAVAAALRWLSSCAEGMQPPARRLPAQTLPCGRCHAPRLPSSPPLRAHFKQRIVIGRASRGPMYGGGGFEAGASQFNGAGFMPS